MYQSITLYYNDPFIPSSPKCFFSFSIKFQLKLPFQLHSTQRSVLLNTPHLSPPSLDFPYLNRPHRVLVHHIFLDL
ncbi:hypothetical protein A3K55_02380 [Candidatus Shapirobacteria bacterium RBG_13_44_7]|uniref:Uncharacterized protein n=1 Tax=Candidatus Shapirobacteria bacterium RBG_13_44_7 TaxID=1802149 RepID=A0A1F7SEZ6_9BACT|nr:MAG: hypothetical protein A3K55_02380 [Candidatus Shapirobacteria bacterium RBG_13_44_7]